MVDLGIRSRIGLRIYGTLGLGRTGYDTVCRVYGSVWYGRVRLDIVGICMLGMARMVS